MGPLGFIGIGSNSTHSIPLRMFLLRFGHRRSPLSSTRLIKHAFFCDACPDERVREFETQEMAPYESPGWPLATFLVFADPERITGAVGPSNFSGHEAIEDSRPRALVIAGGKDVLIKPRIMEKLTGLLREAARLVFGSVAGDGESREESGMESTSGSFRVVPGGGHQLMNDIHWEEGAERILGFLR